MYKISQITKISQNIYYIKIFQQYNNDDQNDVFSTR